MFIGGGLTGAGAVFEGGLLLDRVAISLIRSTIAGSRLANGLGLTSNPSL